MNKFPALLLTPLLIAAEIAPLKPWSIQEDRVVHTLHVDPASEAGAPDGSRAAPYASLQTAIDQAQARTAMGDGVRLRLRPGHYRETLEISNPKDAAPLILEAVEPGTARITGSDVFGDWQPVEGRPGVYAHAWSHAFGYEENPWPGLMPMNGPGFRRELLFVNGLALRQVEDPAGLGPGTYLVEEAAKQVLLHPSGDFDPKADTVEISVRPERIQGEHSKLLRMVDAHNVVLRGLVFQHAATRLFNDPAVNLLGGGNLLFEDVTLEWNNGMALQLMPRRGSPVENVVLRRVRANHNGTVGLTGGGVNVLIEDCETNHNNWRGAHWGATGWAPCGFKFAGMKGLHLLRHQAVANHASGAWFDTDNTDVLIDGLVALNNFRSGISIEAERGPFLLRNSVFMGNSVGVSAFDTTGVVIRDNWIAFNLNKQLRIAGSTTLSPEKLATYKTDWRRHRLSLRTLPTDIAVTGNRIMADAATADSRLFALEMPRESQTTELDGVGILQPAIDSMTLAGNRFFHPKGPEDGGLFTNARLQPVSFREWETIRPGSGEWLEALPEEELTPVLQNLPAAPTGFSDGRLEDDTLGL